MDKHAFDFVLIVRNKGFYITDRIEDGFVKPAFVMFDLNYFKYCFLKAVGVEPDEIALENDFEKLCQIILQSSGDEAFMYRF